MKEIYLQALKNVRSQPAPYTVMVIVIIVGIASLAILAEAHRIYALLLILVSIVVMLKWVLASDDRVRTTHTDSGGRLEPVFFENHGVFELSEACSSLVKSKGEDHPILVMLSGYLKQFSQQVSRGQFEISAEHYNACFAGLLKSGNANIYAIADLDSYGESWNITQPTLWVGIKERLFHLSWKHLYSQEFDDFVIKSLNKDKDVIEDNKSIIRLLTSRESLDMDWWSHPLNQEAVGFNLLIIGDQLLGGYVQSKYGVALRLEAPSSLEVAEAKSQYDRMATDSITISPHMSAREIRSKWIERFKIGEWDPKWNGVQERGRRYVHYYDQHIYCWIP